MHLKIKFLKLTLAILLLFTGGKAFAQPYPNTGDTRSV